MSQAGGGQQGDQEDLSIEEPSAGHQLPAASGDVRGVDAKLDELDLVDGEQQVGGPQRPCRGIQARGYHVIRSGRSGSQSRGANHLGRGPRRAPNPLEGSLHEEGSSGGRADPQQGPIPPVPKQPDQSAGRNCRQRQRGISGQPHFAWRPGANRRRSDPALHRCSQPEQGESRDGQRRKSGASSSRAQPGACAGQHRYQQYAPGAVFPRNDQGSPPDCGRRCGWSAHSSPTHCPRGSVEPGRAGAARRAESRTRVFSLALLVFEGCECVHRIATGALKLSSGSAL